MKIVCKHFSGGGNFKHPVTSCTKGTLLSLLLAVCTAFTACSNDESLLPDIGNQLRLSFGINAPDSRAIFTDTKLPDASPVGVKLSGYADYANLVYTGSTTGSKQTWSSTTSVTLTDTKGTLYAYWPQNNAVSIDAIDVDMTAADQTDWLYATPVTDVNKNKASVAVTMNHAAANINVKVNKGSYKGAGTITNITLQSDGIALGGTFNAAKSIPGYEAYEDEGKPLSRTVSTTAGGAATDIMVVPTGTSAPVTFTVTIDGADYTVSSSALELQEGSSYAFTLTPETDATLACSYKGVKPWSVTAAGSKVIDTGNGYAINVTGDIDNLAFSSSLSDDGTVTIRVVPVDNSIAHPLLVSAIGSVTLVETGSILSGDLTLTLSDLGSDVTLSFVESYFIDVTGDTQGLTIENNIFTDGTATLLISGFDSPSEITVSGDATVSKSFDSSLGAWSVTLADIASDIDIQVAGYITFVVNGYTY